MLYWTKTNWFIKTLFSKQVWSISNTANKIYLTFDDGPTPEVTEWVLGELEKANAKATFFCIGNNIEKHPEIFKKVISQGHSIGNHTLNHLKGWETDDAEYIENVKKCESTISNLKSKTPNLKFAIFRPPYGKIKLSQAKIVRKLGYKIIMWDVLSADFDQTISPEKCLENVIKNTKSGSIIVFHDSVKAFKNLQYVLPKALAFLKQKGFIFDVIPN